MHTTRWLALLGSLGMFALPAPAYAEEDADRGPDAELLREAGVPTDAAGLLGYLRRHTGSDVGLRRLDQLIRQLGSSQFREREEASKKLIGLGPAALPALGRARPRKELDTVRRAEECIREINSRWNPAALSAAVRVLARLQPPGTIEALLHFLPHAADESTSEDVWFALDALVARHHPPAILMKGLTDQLPARRAAAAYLLGRYGDRAQRDAMRPLLDDAQGEVRLRAAQGLLGAKETRAIPTLVALLDDPSVEVTWQAEEMLHWVAGEGTPQPTVGAGAREARRQCTEAWQAWWRKHGADINLAGLEQDYRRPGLFLVCDSEDAEGRRGRVWLCGCDGRLRWQLSGLNGPADVHWLGGGRVLVAEAGIPRAAEYDSEGELHWSHQATIHTCQRLPDGNTLIFHRGSASEVTPAGKVVTSRACRPTENDYEQWPSRWLAGKPSGQHLPRFTGYAVRLRGGGLLGPCAGPRYSRLVEIDRVGRVVWEVFTPGRYVGRLRACLGLVRLGWPARPNVDLETSVEHRRRGLASREPHVRIGSMGWLPVMGTRALPLTPALIDALLDPDRDVRNSAAEALLRLGPRTLPALLEAMRDRRPALRAAAGGVVGRMPGAAREALPVLGAALEDESSSVREAAVQGIGLLGGEDPSAVRLLREALKDKDLGVRHSAIRALGHMGRVAKAAYPDLLEVVNDRGQDSLLRNASAFALTSISRADSRVVPALVALLDEKESPSLRCSAAQCLARVGARAQSAVPALVRTLDDNTVKDPVWVRRLQYCAAYALGEMGTAAAPAVPGLVKLLEDEQSAPDVRRQAVEALGTIGPAAKEAVPRLVAILSGKGNPTEPSLAAASLGRIGPASIPALQKALKDTDVAVRGRAVEALSKIGPPAKEALQEALTDQSPSIRRFAARALDTIERGGR